MLEQTVIIIKPDAVRAGHIGEIIKRLEGAGFKLAAAKFMRLTQELLETWYAHHKDKPFFPDLVAFMTSTPVMTMLWEGDDIVGACRELCGPTDSTKAPKGTIRADLGIDIQQNAIHASENAEAAEKEKALMFTFDEIYSHS